MSSYCKMLFVISIPFGFDSYYSSLLTSLWKSIRCSREMHMLLLRLSSSTLMPSPHHEAPHTFRMKLRSQMNSVRLLPYLHNIIVRMCFSSLPMTVILWYIQFLMPLYRLYLVSMCITYIDFAYVYHAYKSQIVYSFV